MITKITLNGDLSLLKTAIEETGLFETVTISNDMLSCYDAGGNLLCEMNSSNTFTAYSSAIISQSAVFGTQFSLNTAYCYNGAIIFYYSNSANTYTIYIMMSRTNTGAVAITFSSNYGARLNSQQSVYCIAWGDTDTITALSSLQNITRRQVSLMTIPTNSVDVHTTNAFYMPTGNLTGNAELEFTLNGIEYFTTGYFVIAGVVAS